MAEIAKNIIPYIDRFLEDIDKMRSEIVDANAINEYSDRIKSQVEVLASTMDYYGSCKEDSLRETFYFPLNKTSDRNSNPSENVSSDDSSGTYESGAEDTDKSTEKSASESTNQDTETEYLFSDDEFTEEVNRAFNIALQKLNQVRQKKKFLEIATSQSDEKDIPTKN